jgi:hypothetical protein
MWGSYFLCYTELCTNEEFKTQYDKSITLEHIIYKRAITRKLQTQPRAQQHMIISATNIRDGWEDE